MKYALNHIFAACLLTMPLAAFSQSDLTRMGAVTKALEQNLGIRMARLDVERAEVGDAWGAAGALPQIGLNSTLAGAVSDQSENPTSFIQERLESQSINLGAQLNWVVFDGFGMFANKRALETLVEQADGQARLMIEQTVAAVLQAYDAVLVEERLLSILDGAVEASKARVAWTGSRQDFGAATQFDVLQVENAYLSDQLSRAQQALAVDVAKRTLNRLLGADLTADWTLISTLDVPEPVDFKALEVRVLSDGTTMQNARIAESLAQIGVDQAQSRLSPTVQLSASQGDQRSQFAAGDLSGDGRVKNLSANLVLNFNLFNGGATRRAIEQAKIQVMVAEHAAENQRQEVLRILGDAQDRWELAAMTHEFAQQLSANASRSLEIAEARYRSGAMNALDLREVQLQSLRAAQQEFAALQGWLAADVELDRLAGDRGREQANDTKK